MSRFGIIGPDEFLTPFGYQNGQGGSFGNTERDDEGKEICWQKTKFKGYFKVDPVKPVVKFSIAFEMWCECGPDESNDWDTDMNKLQMKTGTKPPCNEFRGKFQNRSHDCSTQTLLGGFYSDIDEGDCCKETKCAIVEKEISFEDLMPIPFELLTQGGGNAGGTCSDGPNAPVFPGGVGSYGPGFENTGDSRGNSKYTQWGSEPGWPGGGAGKPDFGVPLTPRAQALRIFGCGWPEAAALGEAMESLVADSGMRSGADITSFAGGMNALSKDEDDPGPGDWHYARVKTPEERDAVLRGTLVCKKGSPSKSTKPGSELVATGALQLCFTLGGAFDTDYDDSDPGGYGKPDSVGDDDLNAGLRDEGEDNDPFAPGTKEPGGWFNKMRPKFDCYTCECEDPLLSGVWAPPFDCTDPPCEDPPKIK